MLGLGFRVLGRRHALYGVQLIQPRAHAGRNLLTLILNPNPGNLLGSLSCIQV